MFYEGVLDPATSAVVASDALSRALTTLQQVMAAAGTVATTAAQVSAAQAAISAMLKALGVNHRWSGTVLQLQLPDGTWAVGADLKGDKGNTGPAPVIQIGTVGSGDDPAVIIAPGSDPEKPTLDWVLPRGLAAWSPIFAIVTSGSRRVLQIADWTGGGGTKPTPGVYVGPAGPTTFANAIDLGALPGSLTVDGSPNAGDLAIFNAARTALASGGALSALGQTIVSAATAATVLAAIGAQPALGFMPEAVANKGVANGYAGLDATGKVPTTQLPASVLGDVQYQAAWNAATNTPAIPAAAPANKGWYYVVGIAGSTSIGGVTDWQVGDWLVSDGAAWDKIDNTDAVKSVAGLVGAITATALKAALGIGSADIVDATATGRAVMAVASAAALTAMLAPMTGDAGSGGKAGLVPAPAAGDAAAGRFLRADGSWAPPGLSAATNYLLCLGM